ncbi:hypothetical protein JJL56_01665 [Azospirillum sp. YIM DDC1]|uniref:Sel1 repeat family protein n=1 Tax=Azospirillum aestuarii TaxID=2802052 RepID=A0ABS1HRX0_9PROT|nr:hypothetical protein [Azospirillum aestuarii]MBK4717568.1 hypothetical protein [Azospirillum aestuarii]
MAEAATGKRFAAFEVGDVQLAHAEEEGGDRELALGWLWCAASLGHRRALLLLVEELIHRLVDADTSDDANASAAPDAWVARDPAVGELDRAEAWTL